MNKNIKQIIDQINRSCGEGILKQLGKQEQVNVDCMSTGIYSLDQALGGKGLPKGRVVELYGPESSGKTTLALKVIAEAQSNNGIAAFIDAEHALDLTWARKIGVDINSLLFSQPDSGEQALDIVEKLILSNKISVIVVDSVASLVPMAELQGEMGQSHIGLQARLMSQAMRKLTGVINHSQTCLIFINQIRMKVGVLYGNPETTPGGNALKFYSSVRLDIRKKEYVKDGPNVTGMKIRAKVVKNKIAAPFHVAEFVLDYDHGFDFIADLITMAVDRGIVQKSGAWINYGELRLGQGMLKAKQFLLENPELIKELKEKL